MQNDLNFYFYALVYSGMRYMVYEVKGENTKKEHLMLKIGLFGPFLPSVDGQRAQLNYQVQTQVHGEGSSVHCSVQVRIHNTQLLIHLLFTAYLVSFERLNTKK